MKTFNQYYNQIINEIFTDLKVKSLSDWKMEYNGEQIYEGTCEIDIDGFEYFVEFFVEGNSMELLFSLKSAPKENVLKFIELYEANELPDMKAAKQMVSFIGMENLKRAIKSSTGSVELHTEYLVGIPGLPFIKVLSQILGAYEPIFQLLENITNGDLPNEFKSLENIDMIFFSADNDEHSRVRLYEKFASKVASRLGTEVNKRVGHSYTMFQIPVK